MLGKIVKVESVREDSPYEVAYEIERKVKYYQDKGYEAEIHYSSLGRSHTATYSALIVYREPVEKEVKVCLE